MIRRRTILGGLLALLLVAAGWSVAFRVAHEVEREAVRAGEIYAEHSATVAEKIAEGLERQLRELNALAQQWLAHQSDTQRSVQAELVRAMVRQLHRSGSYVSHYMVHDRDGRVLWQSDDGVPTLGSASPEALPPLVGFRNPASDLWLEVIASRDNNESVGIYASVGLVGDGGELTGVTVAVLQSSALSLELARARLVDGFVLALILDTGQLIARSAPGPLEIGSPVGDPAVTARLAAADRGQIRAISTVTGRDQIIAWRRLPNLNLFAIGTTNAEQQLATALGVRRTAFVAAGLATVFVVLALLVWLRMRDVEDARSAALAQQALRGELERLIGGIPALFFLRQMLPDASSRLVYRGGDLEAVTGWPARTFDGCDSLAEWTELEDAEREAFFARVASEGTASIEYRFRQPNGGFRHMRLHCRRLRKDDAGVTEIVGYMLDVTSEAQAEARAQVAARLASLGAISAGLAHELKQPLTAISLAAEVAQVQAQQIGASAITDRLGQIVEEVDKTVHLIESLRRFARGSGAEPELRSVAVGAVVESAVSLVWRHLRTLSINIDVDTGPPGLAAIGEPEAIKQILVNLLTNAGDALGAIAIGGRRHVTVHVEKDASSGRVSISVADNGGGIAPHVLPRLFEPFVTTKPAEFGTGLGLSVSHGLAKAMMGEIRGANSGDGAVFTLLLEAAPD